MVVVVAVVGCAISGVERDFFVVILNRCDASVGRKKRQLDYKVSLVR